MPVSPVRIIIGRGVVLMANETLYVWAILKDADTGHRPPVSGMEGISCRTGART
jgi:hypothetical protein